ncbi:MAG: DUF2971 domain-containing protein [Ruminococcus sp.]
MKYPEFLYKYISVNSQIKVNRLIDIIINKHLYFPKFSELNDIFEGCYYNYSVPVAGSSISEAIGSIPAALQCSFDKFRILSLTSVNNSPVMWAHYATEFNGVCLRLRTDTELDKAQRVIYKKNKYGKRIIANYDKNFYNSLKKNFCYKGSDWSYEKEWRIIENDCKDNYFDYGNSLDSIILGQKVDRYLQKFIYSLIKDTEIKLYITHSDKINYEIKFLEYGSDIPMDGSLPAYVSL